MSRTLTEDEDAKLKAFLKHYKIINLYEKFRTIGVTAEEFWDVEEEDLHEHEFSNIIIFVLFVIILNDL